MAQGFRLPAYEVPNKMLDLAPLNSALDGYQSQMNTNAQFGMAQKRENRDQETFDDAKKQRAIDRLGRHADMYLNEPDPKRKAAIGSSFAKLHPQLVPKLQEAGMDPNDHETVARFLKAETSGYDPLGEKQKKAQIDATKANTAQSYAHADYYRGRANIDQKERWKLDPTRNIMVNSITGETRPIYAGNNPASVDPLEGAGIDDNGAIVPRRAPGGQGEAPLPVPDFVPSTRPQGRIQAPGVMVSPPAAGPDFSGRMNLGGPTDDIERSMRLDEGRPQGVQVAQAGGGSVPAVPGIRPELMNQAMSRFGATGMTSPQVPGVVTDAGRNRRVDVPATREMQGQRAFDQATPDQQDRLMKFRQDQELWTGVYKRPPRAGYYYGNDGREMALTDKNFKGDRENQAVALMNMNKVEQASKKLLDSSYLTRTVAGAANIGEIGQAFADMKQGALGIAYALSGKTVAVAEMKNFIEAYGPVPGDGAERIQAKTQRMRDFYQALLTASRGGESYETAFARAMASTGLKNPDGSPAGAPAAASGGTRAAPSQNSDLRNTSTEDLIRRLNGGR